MPDPALNPCWGTRAAPAIACANCGPRNGLSSSAARARARRRAGARCRGGKRARSQPEPHTPSPTSSRIPFPFRPAFTVLGLTLTVYTKFRWREQLFNTLVKSADALEVRRDTDPCTPSDLPSPTAGSPARQIAAAVLPSRCRNSGGAHGRRQRLQSPCPEAHRSGAASLSLKPRRWRDQRSRRRPATQRSAPTCRSLTFEQAAGSQPFVGRRANLRPPSPLWRRSPIPLSDRHGRNRRIGRSACTGRSSTNVSFHP